MKILTHTLPFLASSVLSQLNSDCVDGDLVINIPVENERMASVLRLSAGDCDQSNIPNGIDNAVTYDADNSAVEIKIPIDACNMQGELYSESVIRAAAALYRPTANITLGTSHNDLEIVFKNLHIAAECGMKTMYQVDFEYNVVQEDADECVMVDGICVFPGSSEDVRFEIIEYSDSSYSSAAEVGSSKPGEYIYMEVSHSEIPEGYDWAVTQCIIINDQGIEHEIINPAAGSCSFDEIDFQTSYEDSGFRMSHILFLLDDKKQANYTLRCFVELCDSSDENNSCYQARGACDPDEIRTTVPPTTQGQGVENCNLNIACLGSDYCFSNCGATGRDGPSLANCQSSYTSNQLANIRYDANSFNVYSGIQRWTVPTTGTYEIIAIGARGGGNEYPNDFQGRGAVYKSEFSLTAGEQINILVGQEGGWGGYSYSAGSGGGGSYVVKTDGTILIIAAGGGGMEYGSVDRQFADGRWDVEYGQNGGPTGGAGGPSGYGGSAASNNGCSGGGGYHSTGETGRWGTGGTAFVLGGRGGDYSSLPICVGGFGGGAGTHGTSGGGGGGGGYSGGGGGDHTPSNGGGGGSYSSGANKQGCSGANDGHGLVIIRYVSARFAVMASASQNERKVALVVSDVEDVAVKFDGRTSDQ